MSISTKLIIFDFDGTLRGVGLIRAKANIAKVERRASLLDMPRCSNVTIGNIALTNLVYNTCILVQIKKYQPYLIATQ